jgi:(p)ppGpp synthase/HD superfamily hydrolase
MQLLDLIQSTRIEKAVIFAARAWEESPHNPKPTLFHSLRVSFALLEFGYPAEYAELAILHDILEDTSTTYEDIARQFGKEAADLVDSLSHRESIQNWEERYNEMFRRVVAAGKMAIIVKMVDIADNSLYIEHVENRTFQADLVKKMKVFLDLSEMYSAEPAWKYLHSRWEEEHRRLEG